MSFRSIILIAFASVSIKGEILFDPCFKDDIKCLSTATETFLSKTYVGVPNLGIKPIDPMIIESVQVADEDLGLDFNFKNASITGLKSLKIEDFKMDVSKKTVLLKMQVDVVIVGDMQIELTKSKKTFNGVYTASTKVLGTSNYGYSLKEVNGDQYFEVGPETNTCEIVGVPTVTLGDLQNELDKDSDAKSLKPEWEPKKLALRKRTLCTMMDSAFVTIIHNLRTAGNLFPKTAFFKDI